MKERNEEREIYLYHNTEVLLRKYRDVVWSVEVSAARTEMNFETVFGINISEFLDMSYAAGADLSGTDIEGQMRTIEKNRKMLEIIDKSLDVVRKKHRCGEMYYQIIFLTYMSSKEFENTAAILSELAEQGFYMSSKTYFKRKREAINLLSDILWGFTSKYTNSVCEALLKKRGE